GLNQNSDIVEVVSKVYHYISHEIRDVSNSEQTDVSSALMFGEANGITKNRMFVAMLRTLGVPSRLVGGLLLKPEETQRIHRWVEVYIGNHWVPFDPLQRKFAELPENYLTVYYGDYPFFRHNRNIDFKYSIGVERRLFLNTDLRAYPLNLMNAQPFFQKAGLPLDLLQIIITIPIGAVVIIIFRNVIGIQTFGTFLPVLIAATFRESGLFWGIIIFVLIILVGALLRSSLNGLRILHTPKLTILLVYVVLALLAVSALGVGFGNEDLGYTSLFPLALMALTIERFSLITEENGIKTALVLFANTVVTVIFCYVVITSILLQTIVLAYPEVLLLVVSVSIYLGAWKGLRITELIRFRKLIFRKEILS
ncbi:MAG: hypothetical protein GWN00_37930, partial [Aliifodinibius sp.]|nr:hypothetical protein [candidate division KSB1 bacterium]NIT61777.1 hypothetical protein [Fodinibius sp.]NIV16383.1 hypothetical protein [Fodinibius sp.]NIY30357.1 hypothetical protein [Fodinibius sp.]